MDRNPFRSIEHQFEQLQRQFEEALNMWGGEDFEMPEIDLTSSRMGIDLVDRGEEFVLTADVPGFDHDDISLRLSDNTLHVTAEREEKEQEDEELYIKSERRRQTLRRSIQLPEPVDDDQIDARYKNGVLTVILPKKEPSDLDGKKIEIHG